MKKSLSLIPLILGLILIILSNSNITGAFIGTNNSNIILFPGIFFFVIGLFTTATLEQKAEKGKGIARRTALALYDATSGIVRNVFYGLAAPAATTLAKTAGGALKQGLYGVNEGLQDYKNNMALANQYRQAAGLNHGFLRRLNPRENASLAKELENLQLLTDVLKQSNPRITLDQAPHYLEALRTNADPVYRRVYNDMVNTLAQQKQQQNKTRAQDALRRLEEAAPKYRQVLKETKKYQGDILEKLVKKHKRAKKRKNN